MSPGLLRFACVTSLLGGLLLAGCEEVQGRWPLGTVTFLNEATVGGRREIVPESWWPRFEPEFLRERAVEALRCAEARVEKHAQTWAFIGCGKQAVYLAVSRNARRTDVPGYEGRRALLSTMAVVCLSCEGDPMAGVAAGAAGDRQPPPFPYYFSGAGADLSTYEHLRDRVEALVRLNVQGSKDLGCPRAEVFPEMVSTGRFGHTPIAEGCHQRASYLGDRLISRVEMK
jgi:hypothetical protein